MIQSTFKKRVRYSETDQMGFLYYGRFASLYEIGRAELVRELGVTYKSFEEDYNVMLPVVNLECRFKNPAYYDDLLTIITTLKNKPGRMMTFDHIIKNQEGVILNTGRVKLFFVDTKTGQKISCPPFLTKLIDPYFES